MATSFGPITYDTHLRQQHAHTWEHEEQHKVTLRLSLSLPIDRSIDPSIYLSASVSFACCWNQWSCVCKHFAYRLISKAIECFATCPHKHLMQSLVLPFFLFKTLLAFHVSEHCFFSILFGCFPFSSAICSIFCVLFLTNKSFHCQYKIANSVLVALGFLVSVISKNWRHRIVYYSDRFPHILIHFWYGKMVKYTDIEHKSMNQWINS